MTDAPLKRGPAQSPPPRLRPLAMHAPRYSAATKAIFKRALREPDGRPRTYVSARERRALYADSVFAFHMRSPEAGEKGWCVVDGMLFVDKS